jgi:hypothetical protein
MFDVRCSMFGVPYDAESRTSEPKAIAALFALFNRLDDGVEIRPIAGVEFGMEEFAIGANLEGAAA